MKKYKIGITLGDINGIGPEIVLKTFSNENIMKSCTPIIYGSGKVLGYHKNIVKEHNVSFVTASNARAASDNKLNVINCFHDTANINLGKATEGSGRFAYVSLDAAVSDLVDAQIDALVTGPINKNAMQMANFPEKGHTEFIAKKLGESAPLMFMVSDEVKIAVVTAHIPFNEICSLLTEELIREKIQTIDKSLKEDFAIEKPLIAVLGLNPHAGDEGTIGNEESEFIAPLVVELKNSGIMVSGPYSADGFFGGGLFARFDGVLAMYHDQGLIPFKTISFGQGVNFTAGLSAIRTSPDHGTAYDIAGQNIADASSFRAAVYSAIKILDNRRTFNELRTNKLQKQEVPVESR